MTSTHTFLAGHLDPALYAFSLFTGVLADAVLLLLRRGFRGGGFRGFPRRRRPGGILGGLALFFLLGPILVIALIAYALYALFSGFRSRR